MDLVSPAGNLPSLKAAVDSGANAVYFGFRDDTNARHFAGLNFGPAKIADGIRYAQQRGVKVFLAEPGGVATEFMQDAVPSRAGESDVYRTFNDFLKNAGRGSGGADADVIAAEIVDLMENPIGPLRRPLGDQARSVASKLDMMSDEARAQFALNAAGLAWWANGDEPPRG